MEEGRFVLFIDFDFFDEYLIQWLVREFIGSPRWPLSDIIRLSRALLCSPMRSCALPCVLYESKLASVGNYSPITCIPVRLPWPQICLCWRFANPVCSQWPESDFVRYSLVLWVHYVLIDLSLSSICYILELNLVGY